MGLFSSIGKVLGSVGKIAGIAAAPFTGGTSLLATGLDLAGSLYGASEARKAASTSWNRTMAASNTSYQRGVADMRAAGLNPILAYSQGGASTPTAPTASTASLDQLGQAGSRQVNNALSAATLGNTQQQTATGRAQEQLTYQQAERERLNNEGLKQLPPHIRAYGQMANNTGSSIVAGSHYLKRGIDAYRNSPPPPLTPSQRSYRDQMERAIPELRNYRRHK